MSSWTVDASGHYVDWTQPPHREPGSGLINFLLPGEDHTRISWEVWSQRHHEYSLLTRRQMKRKA